MDIAQHLRRGHLVINRMKLSEPVRIGDWEHLGSYPLTALATPLFTKLFLTEPISMEQPVYVPGNDHEGVWS